MEMNGEKDYCTEPRRSVILSAAVVLNPDFSVSLLYAY